MDAIDIGLLIGGLALCFAGWLLYWSGVYLLGGLCGGLVGFGLAQLAVFFWSLAPQAAFYAQLGVTGLGICAGIFALKKFQTWSFFALGFTLGGGLAHAAALLHIVPLNDWLNEPVVYTLFFAAIAFACGGLFVWNQKLILILLTTLLGSMLVVIALPLRPVVLLSPFLFAGAVWFQHVQLRRRVKNE